MENNEIAMKGEGCCLLCLELKEEFVDAVFISSVQYNTINIKLLIEKHLWTMKHITPSSWLCVNCWTELHDFHIFYMRIEKVHGNLELLSKTDENAVDEIESDIRVLNESPLVCPFDKMMDTNNLTANNHNHVINRHIIEFKETPNDRLDCPVGEINDDVANNENNPLLDVEIHGTLVDTPPVEQETKLRKAKLKRNYVKANPQRTRSKKSSDSTEHLRDSTNNTKTNKQMIKKKVAKNEIKSKPEENASDVENLRTKKESSVSAESEKDTFDSDSKNDIETESLLSDQEHSSIKLNHQTKAIRNEKDKFLADNFKMTCSLCDIPFETFCNVHKHFKERHKERGYIQCCDTKFYRRNVLIDHVNYHLDPNFFKCHQCDKVMEDRRRLELHSKSHEINNGKNFCCNICGKGFIKLAMLNAHKKIHVSEEEKRFQCHECGKNFAANYMLTNHCRSTHLKKYHKICEICGKSIQDKTIFERHMQQHEGKIAPSASCDVCGLLLTDEKALERHKKVIHPENGQKMYTCSICAKISPNLRTHKLHVRFTHESGYNYKCTICDKAFKRPQPLKEHMASHTGEVLYTCPWCPKTFNSNANMHNHRKKVHPKEWEETSRQRYSGKLPPRFKPPTTIEHNDATTPDNSEISK